MFRDEPNEVCMQHTGRQKVAFISHIPCRGNLSLLALLVANLAPAELIDDKLTPSTKCQCGLEFNGDGQCVVCDF